MATKTKTPGTTVKLEPNSSGPPTPTSRLQEFLKTVHYKEGWQFRAEALSLMIVLNVPNNLHPDRTETFCHQFALPSYWPSDNFMMRWLFDCIMKVECHEAMEIFQVNGAAPYFPNHIDFVTAYEPILRSSKGC